LLLLLLQLLLLWERTGLHGERGGHREIVGRCEGLLRLCNRAERGLHHGLCHGLDVRGERLVGLRRGLRVGLGLWLLWLLRLWLLLLGWW
jgi:hypothetical protein